MNAYKAVISPRSIFAKICIVACCLQSSVIVERCNMRRIACSSIGGFNIYYISYISKYKITFTKFINNLY